MRIKLSLIESHFKWKAMTSEIEYTSHSSMVVLPHTSHEMSGADHYVQNAPFGNVIPMEQEKN